MAVSAFEDPRLISSAAWVPAVGRLPITLNLFCVAIDPRGSLLGRASGTELFAAGRSTDGRLYLIRATDAGIGNPEQRDAFGVLAVPAGTPPPTAISNPKEKCAAWAVVTRPAALGDFVGISDPED